MGAGILVKCPSRYENRIRHATRTLHRTNTLALPSTTGRRSFASSAKKQGETPSNEKQSSFFSSLLAWYSNKLDTHPLLTKAISSGVIAGSGDFLCQLFVDPRNADAVKDDDDNGVVSKESSTSLLADWDMARTGRFAILGAFFVAPGIHYWYNALSMRIIPGAATVSNVLKRVAVDQFLFSPLFLQVWLSALWTMEGETKLETVPGRLMEATPTILVANWILWIPAQLLNFRMVPVKYQVLYSNVVALFWNVYLSSTATTPSSTSTKEPPLV
jgi:hypothetical protein